MNSCPEADVVILYRSRQLPGEQMEAVRDHLVHCSQCADLLCLDLPETPPKEFNGLRIVRRLGGGCHGAVYLAKQLSLDRDVAVKLVREGYDEARQAARIDHPNVVRIVDTGQLPTGGSYIVMQYVPGRRLTEVPRPIAPELLRPLARQLAAGLAAIHAGGLVHRDLHLGNVLVHGDRVTIIDFGNALRCAAPPSELPALRCQHSPRDDVRAVGRILRHLSGETWEPQDGALARLVQDCVGNAQEPRDGASLLAALDQAERHDQPSQPLRDRRPPWRLSAARPGALALLGMFLLGGAAPRRAPEPRGARPQGTALVQGQQMPVATPPLLSSNPPPVAQGPSLAALRALPARLVRQRRGEERRGDRTFRPCPALAARCLRGPFDAQAPAHRPCSMNEPRCWETLASR